MDSAKTKAALYRECARQVRNVAEFTTYDVARKTLFQAVAEYEELAYMLEAVAEDELLKFAPGPGQTRLN